VTRSPFLSERGMVVLHDPGRPSRGIGDLDDIVEREVSGFSSMVFPRRPSLAASRRPGRLLEDPGLSERCRRLTETRFGVGLRVNSKSIEPVPATNSP
jgi:hypothetical protein